MADISFLIPSPVWDWYSFFKDFQSAIVGTIGFGVGIFTLWWNARLARLARTSAIKHEQTTLRVALAAELRMTAKAIKDIQSLLLTVKLEPEPSIPDGSREIPPLLPFGIYDANLSKLGLLEMHQISAVVSVYTTLKGVRASQIPEESGPSRGLYIVKKDWIQPMSVANEYFLRYISDALELLNKEEH